MALLFEVKDRSVVPTTEALLIPTLKKIWSRDKGVNKNKAIAEFTYIEFMTSKLKSNPYKGYAEEVRSKKLKEDLLNGGEIDSLVEEGMKLMADFQQEGSYHYRFFAACEKSLDTLITFMHNIDLQELNERTGNPLYKPSDVTKTVKEAGETLKTMKVLEDKVAEELYEITKTKGGKSIGAFEE